MRALPTPFLLLLLLLSFLCGTILGAITLTHGEPYEATITSSSPLSFEFDKTLNSTQPFALLVSSCEIRSLQIRQPKLLPNTEYSDFFAAYSLVDDASLITFNVSTTSNQTVTFTVLPVLGSLVDLPTFSISDSSSIYISSEKDSHMNLTSPQLYTRGETCTSGPANFIHFGRRNGMTLTIDGLATNTSFFMGGYGLGVDSNIYVFKPLKGQTQILDDCVVPQGLEFCEVYYGAYGSSNFTLYDETAKTRYFQFLQVLSQYNCDSPSTRYSFIRDCQDCRIAYKRWLCRSFFKKCAAYKAQPQMDSYLQYIELPCISLCYDTYQSCPYNLHFECPIKRNTQSFNLSYSDCQDQTFLDSPKRVYPTSPSAAQNLFPFRVWALLALALALSVLRV